MAQHTILLLLRAAKCQIKKEIFSLGVVQLKCNNNVRSAYALS